MSPNNVGVNLRNQGQKVGMVNILTNGITQLVCKGSAIASPQDLVGKKILVPFKNDMPDIVLQALLKKLKIDAHKVGITYTATPPEAVGLFLSKDYHAAILPEPMASASILKGKTMGVNVVRGFEQTRQPPPKRGGFLLPCAPPTASLSRPAKRQVIHKLLLI